MLMVFGRKVLSVLKWCGFWIWMIVGGFILLVFFKRILIWWRLRSCIVR